MDKIIKALDKRQSLHKITNAMRLVNGRGDDCEGLIIDRYGTHGVIYIYHPRWLDQLEQIKHVLRKAHPFQYIIVKDRSATMSSKADDINTRVIEGSGVSSTVVQEYGLSFHVDVNDGLNAGLFLDMRANRHAVGLWCKDKRVLNCFAYTCAFGVHARAQGATEVVNVDLSKSYLKRGEANYAANKLPVGRGEFLRYDAVKFLVNCVKKSNTFDVIILDPPSFARHEGKTFQVKRDLAGVIGLAITSLKSSGLLFVSTNCSDLTHADLGRMVVAGLNGKKVIKMTQVKQDSDFPATNTFKESYLVGLMVQFT